jgi:hypothetical protein
MAQTDIAVVPGMSACEVRADIEHSQLEVRI